MRKTDTVFRGTLLRAGVVLSGLFAGITDVAAQEAGQLEEVVVTAEKRAEPLQKTPIAIDVVSADSAALQGINGTADLSSAVPGLVMPAILFAAGPNIRGISQQNVTPGDEPAVATYIDGVYMSTPLEGFLSFNNIDRIEVLKGPQGTLFGRNAAAGVINIVTRTPSRQQSLDASVGYGNYNTIESKLYGTTGLADNLATDLAVYYQDQRDGWGRNLVTGGDAFASRDFAIRNKWNWDFDDATNVSFAADYGESRSEVGIAAQIPAGSFGIGRASFPGFYNTTENFPGYEKIKQWGANLQIRHELSWVKLVNIVSYRDLKFDGHQDQDATPAPITNLTDNVPARSVTEELQIAAPDASTVKWIGGFYYLNSKSGFEPLGIPTSGLNLFSYAGTRSYSGFGQATAPLPGLQSTNLTLGLRYTDDIQTITGGYHRISTGLPFGAQADQRASFPKFTYKAALDRSFTDNVLGYVSFSRGFKSGIFNAASTSGPPIKPMVVDAWEAGVKSEWLDRRLRLNLSAFSDRIADVQLTRVLPSGVAQTYNAASERSRGFDLDLEAVPAENLTLNGGVAYTDAFYSSFPNAPNFVPKVNPVTQQPIGGNCSTCFFDASGRPAVTSPRWTGNFGLAYTIHSQPGAFVLAANYDYTSRLFWQPDGRISQPGVGLVNSTATWTSPHGMWDIQLWGKNLADVQYYAYETESALADKASPAAPRTYGINFGVHLK